MVVRTERRDAVTAGTSIAAGDEQSVRRHGFRSAVVQRSSVSPDGAHLLFVEIMS
ncbi:MAG: hypothetical protein ACYTGC_12095 [Planctomycetota bacterium]|jgi:hypothetical protein